MKKWFRCSKCREGTDVIHYRNDLCDPCEAKRLRDEGVHSQGRNLIRR